MKSTCVKKISLLLAFLLGWATLSCVGINPAAPPAPLAEIPSNLQFPDSIQVDTPEVAPAGGSASMLLLRVAQVIKNQVSPVGGQFFEAIALGFLINERADLAVSLILQDLNSLQIPFNPVTRTFEISGPTLGAFLGQGVKIDFADFDFFDAGTTVGCTGCTCPTGCDEPCPTSAPVEDLRPVCYRIWVDRLGTGEFTRTMAGFFTQVFIPDDPNTPENEKNPGAGNFRFGVDSIAAGGVLADSIRSGADYNHREFARPLDKSTEYFVSFIQFFNASVNATMSHVKVEQQALDEVPVEERLLKTIRESVNQEKFDDPNFDSTFQYVARYRTDADFWSGTLLNDLLFPELAFAEPPVSPDFTAECAQLSTGFGVDESNCIDLGIDVTNVPFLDLISSDDNRVNFPQDFPATPTF